MVGTTAVRCTKPLANEVREQSSHPGEMGLSLVSRSYRTVMPTSNASVRSGVVGGAWRLGNTISPGRRTVPIRPLAAVPQLLCPANFGVAVRFSATGWGLSGPASHPKPRSVRCRCTSRRTGPRAGRSRPRCGRSAQWNSAGGPRGRPAPRLSRMRVVAGGQMTTVRTAIRLEHRGQAKPSTAKTRHSSSAQW